MSKDCVIVTMSKTK